MKEENGVDGGENGEEEKVEKENVMKDERQGRIGTQVNKNEKYNEERVERKGKKEKQQNIQETKK